MPHLRSNTPPGAPKTFTGPRRRILVVDDDPEIRNLMEAMLLREGYEVHLTGDPKEATEIARSKGVDLVLCDIVMPELDGYAVHRELKKEPNTAAFTASSMSASSRTISGALPPSSRSTGFR